jgi:hypothetical protein
MAHKQGKSWIKVGYVSLQSPPIAHGSGLASNGLQKHSYPVTMVFTFI